MGGGGEKTWSQCRRQTQVKWKSAGFRRPGQGPKSSTPTSAETKHCRVTAANLQTPLLTVLSLANNPICSLLGARREEKREGKDEKNTPIKEIVWEAVCLLGHLDFL